MKHTRAFTLVETLVVVALTAMVGLGLMSMITYFYKSNAYLLETTSAIDSATRGVEQSLELVREASYGENGAYPISAAATSSLSFYSDSDNDSSVELVQLYLLDGTFYRTVTNATGNPPSYTEPEVESILATWVMNDGASPVFTYFDTEGVEMVNPIDSTAVRTVRVRLDVDINPLRAPNVVSFERTATLRNLRSK